MSENSKLKTENSKLAMCDGATNIPNSDFNQRLLTELVPGALLQGLLDSLEGGFVACLLEKEPGGPFVHDPEP